jgi:capsid protein
LQIVGMDADESRFIESAWHDWADAVDLQAKLWSLHWARVQDGEGFAPLIDNPHHGHEIFLDIRPIECDRVQSRAFYNSDEDRDLDGVRLDSFGNVVAYRVLRQHPGGTYLTYNDGAETISADAMLHWFRALRPEQKRGVPEITPALPLFAQLRRYTLATIRAAEAVAEWTLFLTTDASAYSQTGDPEGPSSIEEGPFYPFEFDYGMMTTLPEGWKPFQLKAEQPASTYQMFKRQILTEIARCLNVPYNIAACDSSDYNYASGRLDHQTYYRSIRVEQTRMERSILRRLFAAWLDEARLVYPQLSSANGVTAKWFWDGREHVDPAKEANAQATRLGSLTTTLADEYARQGKDWEAEIEQIAREQARLRDLGLTVAEVSKQEIEVDDDDAEQEN